MLYWSAEYAKRLIINSYLQQNSKKGDGLANNQQHPNNNQQKLINKTQTQNLNIFLYFYFITSII